MSNGPLLLILVLAAIWFLLLRTPATRFETKADFEALAAGGQPVVVEFFSNT
jgi:hypothetical protein